jgi:hypothetical protein
MKQFYFVWHGGDGGDFLMRCINNMLHGGEVPVNTAGKARFFPADNFYIGEHICWKCHVPWENKNFIDSPSSEIIWLHNPDTEIHAKKQITKIGMVDVSIPRRYKKIRKAIAEAYHAKDHEKYYYYAYKSLSSSHQQYADIMKSFIQPYRHTVILNNMITGEEIKRAIAMCFHHMQIRMPKFNMPLIEKYTHKQKIILDQISSWQYLDYPL